jgi:hypothetical protein
MGGATEGSIVGAVDAGKAESSRMAIHKVSSLSPIPGSHSRSLPLLIGILPDICFSTNLRSKPFNVTQTANATYRYPSMDFRHSSLSCCLSLSSATQMCTRRTKTRTSSQSTTIFTYTESSRRWTWSLPVLHVPIVILVCGETRWSKLACSDIWTDGRKKKNRFNKSGLSMRTTSNL